MSKPTTSPANEAQSLLHPKYWGSWIGVFALRMIAALPLPAKRFAGKFFGLAAFTLATKRRHITTVNIRACFPELSEAEQRKLVKETFIQNAIGFFEIAWSWWAKPEDFDGLYSVENLHLFNKAQADGRGILLVGAHFVHLDLCGAMLCQETPIGTIYRKNNNAVLEHVITQGRERIFTHVFERSHMRQIVKQLKSGAAIWYAPDQDFNHRQSVFAPFFGQSASTLTATSKLARLGNAQVLGLFHYRDPISHKYRIVYQAINSEFPTGDDVRDATLVNEMIEQAIREEPSQYMWVHRRFKTRPPGQPSLY